MTAQFLIYCYQYLATESVKDPERNMLVDLHLSHAQFEFATITIFPICALVFYIPFVTITIILIYLGNHGRSRKQKMASHKFQLRERPRMHGDRFRIDGFLGPAWLQICSISDESWDDPGHSEFDDELFL